jgi:hypothetical protein
MGGAKPACMTSRPALQDPSASSIEAALPLGVVPQSRWLATMRRLPLIGLLVPTPQQIRWGALTTYRVRLRAAPATICASTPCYEALLLDVGPGSL